MTIGLESAYQNIMEYIDNLLSEYQLSYSDLFLCGFSQGAMCAMYSGLMCPYKIGGVISFGGILAAQGYIENHYMNKPDVLLLHGQDDEKIRIGALEFTAENLKIKIEGPERSYNQMRIVNNTSKSDFDCKVYSLKQKDEKFPVFQRSKQAVRRRLLRRCVQ